MLEFGEDGECNLCGKYLNKNPFGCKLPEICVQCKNNSPTLEDFA